jgi:hypothetical protein
MIDALQLHMSSHVRIIAVVCLALVATERPGICDEPAKADSNIRPEAQEESTRQILQLVASEVHRRLEQFHNAWRGNRHEP